MLYSKNNVFVESGSPHSLGLKNNLTVPNPGWDSNALMVNEKRFWGAGLQGLGDSGGLFSGGLDYTTWGIGEWACIAVGGYALISMFHTGKHATAAIASYPQGRRRKRAQALRDEAKKIESSKGWF